MKSFFDFFLIFVLLSLNEIWEVKRFRRTLNLKDIFEYSFEEIKKTEDLIGYWVL